MTFNKDILDLAEKVIHIASEKKLIVSTAESCTGGLISGALTEISGASKAFTHGFVTYSNKAKMEMLGVNSETLKLNGAVSAEVVQEMAVGALKASQADIAVSVSGVAGPEGSELKPVGLVFIGVAAKNRPAEFQKFEFGKLERRIIRSKTIKAGLGMLLKQINEV